MASYDYPPWTAPSRIERDKASNSKWSNAKDAFFKPWKRRSQRRKKREQTSLAEATPNYNSPKMNAFAMAPSSHPFAMGVFPGYAMHRSPDDMFREHHVNPRGAVSDISPISKAKKEESQGIFEPPPYKTSRPPLSNIFTMFEGPAEDRRGRIKEKFESPRVTPVRSKEKFESPRVTPARSKEKFESPKVTPVSSTRQLANTNQSPNTSVSNLITQRRHSTPAPVFLSQHSRPTRSSDQSVHSDTSSERSRRRARRNEAVRILPSVPKRDHQVIPEEREDSPDLSKPKQKVVDSFAHHTDTTDGGGIPSGYYNAQPSWPQPGQKLLELEEELNLDEPRKREQRQYFEGPGSFEHQFHHQPPPPVMPIEEKPRHPGSKLKRKESKKAKNKNKAGLKMPVAKLDATNDEDEIKGFDGFMMY